MARGGKNSHKRKTRNKVQLKKNGADESDGNYTVNENEDFDESDDESEESSGEFVEEKGRMKKKVKKVLRQEDGSGDDKPTDKYADRSNKKNGKKTKDSYREEKEDGDYNDSDEADDEEFAPEESDDLNEDEEFTADEVDGSEKEELPVSKTTRIANGRKRKTNTKASKRSKKKQGLKRKSRSNHGVRIRDEGRIATKKSIVDSDSDSDSDSVSSGSFDKEASQIFRSLTTSVRSSSSLKIIEDKDEEIVPIQVGKGKEKVFDMKIEVVQQVCGICLSEDAKNTVRGIINCCSHYFCFACIMEWSKVESRCPSCKQRFATINKTERTDGKSDVTETVITVPERDQIYEPTEEEIIDANENLQCMECEEGGDDAFMLLCADCCAPAHTYCVGLGHEVPEGNWYCDDCRPTAQNPLPDNRENFDLTEIPSHGQHSNGDSASGVSTLYERRRIQRQAHELRNLMTTLSDRSGGVGPTGSQVVQNGSTDSLTSYFFATFPTPQHRPSTSNDPSLGDEESARESAEFNALAALMMDRPFTRSLANRLSMGDDRISRREARARREAGATSVGKEQVQSMVKDHLERISKYDRLGFRTLDQIERRSTHTILAAIGLVHRRNSVYPIRTQRLTCSHPQMQRFDNNNNNNNNNMKNCPCFDTFVSNVVMEIFLARLEQLGR